MILLDSNIVIYGTQAAHRRIRAFIQENDHSVSAISYVETMGYHRLAPGEKHELETFFRLTKVLPLTDPVLDEAVRLRQLRKMALGDSLVAGTALVHGCPVATRNVGDFAWISGLKVIDPFSSATS